MKNCQQLSRVFFWIAIVGVAFVAGFLGGVMTQNSYVDYKTAEDISPIILQDKARGDIRQETVLDELVERMSMSMLAIYDDAGSIQNAKNNEALPTTESFAGYALAITSDGWLVTSAPMEKPLGAYRLFLKTGISHTIESAVRDELTGLSFLKISSKDLRPIQFLRSAGQAHIEESTLLTGWNSAERFIATPEWYRSPRTSSEYTHVSNVIDKRIAPEREFSVYCLPLVAQSSDVIGCTDRSGVISFAYVDYALQSILRGGSLNRSALAIRYRDLSQAPLSPRDNTRPRFGAYLQSVSSPRVLSTQDGQSITLSNGDIITHVNDDALDFGLNLSEALSRFQKGDTVLIRVYRKGSFRDVRIKL
jgi:hypothetical protein